MAPTDALPVELRLAGAEAGAIRRWVESIAGWQPVDAPTAALVPPRLVLADVAGCPPPGGELPVVLLVGERDNPLVAAEAAARGVSGLLAWPEECDRLERLAADLCAGGAVERRRATEISVGGTCGGAGATTIALALAGLVAWRGSRVLAVSHGHVPAPAGVFPDPGALSSAAVWDAAAPAPGVPRLRVVALPAPAPDAEVDPGPATVVVRDLGVADNPDVLVLRRDRPGLEALTRAGSAVSVLVDTGPATPAAVRRLAGGRRVVVVPWSVRVARAGLLQRVPGGLPGSWLRTLAPVLAAGTARTAGGAAGRPRGQERGR